MRNPKRIKIILEVIEKVWTKYPDLRLGQLLMNCDEFEGVLYFVEDEELLSILKEYYEEK